MLKIKMIVNIKAIAINIIPTISVINFFFLNRRSTKNTFALTLFSFLLYVKVHTILIIIKKCHCVVVIN